MVKTTDNLPIVAVTGTKGKTTVVKVLAQVLRGLGKNVMHVDTTGHFVNGVRRSTLDDSKRIWSLVPSVGPGRYLYEFFQNPQLLEDGIAVLESSLGSSNLSGMGYRSHKVGVFLNVFEDHMGSSDRLKTQQDIADAKQFIFERLDDEGFAIVNADDKLVVGKLAVIPEDVSYRIIACGLNFSAISQHEVLKQGGWVVTIENDQVIVKHAKSKKALLNVKDVIWTFNGKFLPSVYNLLFVVGASLGAFDGDLPLNFIPALKNSRLDPNDGRLVVFRSEKGVKIIADYAHEKQSLSQVGDLAKTLVTNNGRVIGVIRFAHDRTNEILQVTAKEIVKHFDSFIVYDKIDGHFREAKKIRNKRFTQKVGYISQVVYDALKLKTDNVERILREDKALERAAEIAQPGDVVVHIVNDDIERSMEFIKTAFGAKLI
ncbi:MAG: Mur ligase family protein [Patescibacteria group bacterium]